MLLQKINREIEVFKIVSTSILFAFLALTILGQEQRQDVQLLPVGRKLAREIKKGEFHIYGVELVRGQVLRVDATEKGVNLRLVLIKGNDKQLLLISDFGAGFERERLTFVVEETGVYGILVGSLEVPLAGNYEITAEIKETATNIEKDQIKAERLLMEARAINIADVTGLRVSTEKWEQARPIWNKLNEKYWESYTYIFLGRAYSALGENQKALSYFDQAQLISKSINDKRQLALVSTNIGKTYLDLNQKTEALSFYNESVKLFRDAGDSFGESAALTGVGNIYFEQGERQKAIEIFTQALLLSEKNNNKKQQATLLNNLGEVYSRENEKQKALEYFKKSLQISSSLGDIRQEITTLNNSGNLYFELGEWRKSIEFHNQSLSQSKIVGDKQSEATALNNSMMVWAALGNRRMAIFYGKQAINKYQELRVSAKGLSNELQKTFLDKFKFVYKNLIELLFRENQLEQAIQILNLYRDEQFFDFNNEVNNYFRQTIFTKREQEIAGHYEAVSEKAGQIGLQIADLKRQTIIRQLNEQEALQLQKLEVDLKTASGEILAVLTQAEIEFSKSPDEKDKVGEIPDLRDMQVTLREISANTKQKAAAVYQLVGAEDFHLLMITADEVKKVSTPVKNSVINQKALDFWALLQSPVYDPNVVGKELCDVVFKPVENVLPKDTKTILWSLDGNLRYVPMAALFDGKQYLAERFTHVNFTRADKERMTRAVKPDWTAVGFGTSERKTVELLGSRISFAALPGVGEELKMLFKKTGGIFEGETLRDAEFSRQKMLDALRVKRPLVHIASHFSFRAGDEARSFLLLGDGTAFTLADMKREANLFAGVELLTLSACNTAAQQAGANGREIDGFAELAQRLGANSVMATLWSVADNSTPWLMRKFYDLKLNKNQNKAAALREAQLALLNGTAEIKPLTTRADLSPIKIVLVEKPEDRKKTAATMRSEVIYLDKKDAPPWDTKKHPPFAHPFYWSPFVLFGNWK